MERIIQRLFRRPYMKQTELEDHFRLQERLAERARIARELHDTLFQGFMAISIQLHHAVDQLADDSPGKTSLTHALGTMHRVLDEGREVLSGLRSSAVASMNLEQALSLLRDEFQPDRKVQFRVFVKGEPKELKSEIREQIYLIGREALVNAMRHSEATSIEAEVEYLPRRLRLTIRDNGKGIDPELVRSKQDAHWGLLGMGERAGSIGAKLRIWSRIGAGTEVEISVPGRIAVAATA